MGVEYIKAFLNKQGPNRFSHEETCALITKAQAGDIKARNLLIEFNLKMAFQVCFRYQSTTGFYPRIEMEDLVQESTFGMIRAIELFDISKGHQFSTYAYFWIHQSLRRYIDNTKYMVRVPIFAIAIQKQYKKLTMDIAGKDEDFYIRLLAFENDVSVLSITNSLRFRGEVTSVDQTVNEDGDPTIQLETLTWEPNTTDIDAFTIKKMAQFLGERDLKILTLRMENYSLMAIAEMLKISRERVRQIEESSIIKLRAMVNKSTKEVSNGGITIDGGKEVHKEHFKSDGGNAGKRFFSPNGLGQADGGSPDNVGGKLRGADKPRQRQGQRQNKRVTNAKIQKPRLRKPDAES